MKKQPKKVSHFINVWAAEDKCDLFIQKVKDICRAYPGPRDVWFKLCYEIVFGMLESWLAMMLFLMRLNPTWTMRLFKVLFDFFRFLSDHDLLGIVYYRNGKELNSCRVRICIYIFVYFLSTTVHNSRFILYICLVNCHYYYTIHPGNNNILTHPPSSKWHSSI